MVSSIRRYAQIFDVLGQYGLGIGLERLFPGRARFRLPTPGMPGKTPDTSTREYGSPLRISAPRL